MNQTNGAMADFSRSGVSRYIQLSTLFRRNITSGRWPAGQQIPTIDELAEECGVARATIRQAIGLLEADGLVSRFRAKGTFVNDVQAQSIWCDVETDWNGLLSSRDRAEIEILADHPSVTLPPSSNQHGVASFGYRYLRRRHSRDGQAFLLAEVYIDERMAKKLPEEYLSTKTALRLAASLPGVKIVEAYQNLTVGSADMQTAQLLEIDLNAPVCFVDRFAIDQRGRLVLVAKGIYRGDTIRMNMKLR